jgi:hypothetical protein
MGMGCVKDVEAVSVYCRAKSCSPALNLERYMKDVAFVEV